MNIVFSPLSFTCNDNKRLLRSQAGIHSLKLGGVVTIHEANRLNKYYFIANF